MKRFKMAMIAVSAVILVALSAIFIPMPWAAVIGLGSGRWIYSFFDYLK